MDVKTLCLGALSERPMTGYEIKKQFEAAFRHFFLAGYGSIYPSLAQLAKEGFVSATEVEQDSRPDKKIYSITELGRDRLRDELLETEPRHRVRSEFLVMMYFAHLMPAGRVTDVMEEMIGKWEKVLLEDIEAFENEYGSGDPENLTPGQRFACGYGRAVLTAALAYTKRQKSQLLRKIDEEAELPDSQLQSSDSPIALTMAGE